MSDTSPHAEQAPPEGFDLSSEQAQAGVAGLGGIVSRDFVDERLVAGDPAVSGDALHGDDESVEDPDVEGFDDL